MSSQSKTSVPVQIVVPTYNGLEYTTQMVDSVLRFTPPELARLLIIDNASVDGTREFLSHANGKFDVVLNESNRNFAGACNQGAALSTSDHILFLNSDIIVGPQWLDRMFAALQADTSIGAVGNRQRFPDSGLLHHCGVLFDKHKHPNHYIEGAEIDDPRALLSREYSSLTASCFLTPKELFLGLGGFDEAYLNGYEDTDYCMKLRSAGKRLWYCAESVVSHFTSVSEGRRAHNNANWKLFFSRWAPSIVPDLETRLQEDESLLRAYFQGNKSTRRVAVLAADQDAAARERSIALVQSWRREALTSGIDKEIVALVPQNQRGNKNFHWVRELSSEIPSRENLESCVADYRIDSMVLPDWLPTTELSIPTWKIVDWALQGVSSSLGSALATELKLASGSNARQEVHAPKMTLIPDKRLIGQEGARAEVKLPPGLTVVTFVGETTEDVISNIGHCYPGDQDIAHPHLVLGFAKRATSNLAFGNFGLSRTSGSAMQVALLAFDKVVTNPVALVEAGSSLTFLSSMINCESAFWYFYTLAKKSGAVRVLVDQSLQSRFSCSEQIDEWVDTSDRLSLREKTLTSNFAAPAGGRLGIQSVNSSSHISQWHTFFSQLFDLPGASHVRGTWGFFKTELGSGEGKVVS